MHFCSIHSSIIACPFAFDCTMPDNVEIANIRLIHHGLNLTLCCIYVPPNMSSIVFKSVLDCLHIIISSSQSSLVIGDLNLPDINWGQPQASFQPKSSDFVIFCSECGLD